MSSKLILGAGRKDSSGKTVISKVKIQNSNNNNVIQLADMVCGAVARFYTDKKDAKEFRKLIAHRFGKSR